VEEKGEGGTALNQGQGGRGARRIKWKRKMNCKKKGGGLNEDTLETNEQEEPRTYRD